MRFFIVAKAAKAFAEDIPKCETLGAFRYRIDPLMNFRRMISALPAALWALWAVFVWPAPAAEPPRAATFVFTSDVHYGINRSRFRGEANVPADVVNAAMVQAINALPGATLPKDDGLHAGQPVGPIDFVVITGDLTNRQELYPLRIQSASESWAQFERGFLKGLTLKTAAGRPTPLWLVPGNHDVSNAIGWTGPMVPEQDATTLSEIYNRMLSPAIQRTKDDYSYAKDKIRYTRDVAGAHCVFLTVWPDWMTREWMEVELRKVPATTPVFIFCHDPPEAAANHFTNPNGTRDINAKDKFENILDEVYRSGKTTADKTIVEQQGLALFLKAHPNIVAFFHGHINRTEFYRWKGPDGDLDLATFRADSPMKGAVSGPDERKLAFNVVTFDVAQQKLTAREYLWNASGEASAPSWGESKTVSIATTTALLTR